MAIPPAGPLVYTDVLTGETKTLEDYPFVEGVTAGNMRERCLKKEKEEGGTSIRTKMARFPGYAFWIKKGTGKFTGKKLTDPNEHNVVEGKFVLGGMGKLYYD